MKAKRSIETIINAPSRFDGDEYHFYRPTDDSLLGEPDVLLDGVDALTRAMQDEMPTAEDVSAALLQLFVHDKVKKI